MVEVMSKVGMVVVFRELKGILAGVMECIWQNVGVYTRACVVGRDW